MNEPTPILQSGPATPPPTTAENGASSSSSAAPMAVGFQPLALLKILRPQQWTKNGALLIPLVFALKLMQVDAVLHALWGVLCFCVVSGSVYVFNDVVDREKDRLHPEKRKRPVASGALPVSVALVWGTVCIVGGLTLAWWVSHQLCYVCSTYFLMQMAYSLKLKQLAILDVMIIAVGFVIRVVAGAAAISVPVSNWLYLCTLCGALFLGFCKRRHELMLLEGSAHAHRANLADYSPALLDQIIGTTTAMTLLSYALYTMSADTVEKFHTDNLKLTIPFAFYGVFRYLFLVYKQSQGGSPERILLRDTPTRVNLALYFAVVVAVLYFGSQNHG